MSKVLKINPVTRIEGHLDIEVTVETVEGRDQVIEARAAGPMFRGFEIILAGRDPRDAVHYTQRICGVCPVTHAMASTLALENAFGVHPADNGRILRNLILGSNYLNSHILHFYHLSAPDYLNTEGILDLSPWKPRSSAPDLVGGSTAATLVGHYVKALEIRRKSHQMGAIFSGRLPGCMTYVPGGCTQQVTADAVAAFRGLLGEIRTFINDTYLPDVTLLAGAFPEYKELGRGSGNLLSYGVFNLNATGSSRLFAGGRYTGGEYAEVNTDLIKEYVSHSWFTPESGDLNPRVGLTEPAPGKDGAYSWVKAPRYEDTVHEVGPLARMWITNDYREGISVLDRITARAQEASKIAQAMDGWLNELAPGEPVYNSSEIPVTSTGVGLTEAPRGALGHWIDISDSKISHYQVVTPTAWNASPRDDLGQPGAIEQALVGTPVQNMSDPVEVLRVVHSFDPCLACAVHTVRPGKRGVTTVYLPGPDSPPKTLQEGGK